MNKLRSILWNVPLSLSLYLTTTIFKGHREYKSISEGVSPIIYVPNLSIGHYNHKSIFGNWRHSNRKEGAFWSSEGGAVVKCFWIWMYLISHILLFSFLSPSNTHCYSNLSLCLSFSFSLSLFLFLSVSLFQGHTHKPLTFLQLVALLCLPFIVECKRFLSFPLSFF